MGYYNKYPGYIIKQREENTGSLNPDIINLTGTITYLGGAIDSLGKPIFETRQVPFVFHQPNLPSYKLSCIPYRVVDSSMNDGDDNTYKLNNTENNCNYGKQGSFIITDELIWPTSGGTVPIFTVGSKNLFLTDVYIWITDLDPAQAGSFLQYSIGYDVSYRNICNEQTTTSPGFGTTDAIGIIFRTRFETTNTPDTTTLRGPIPAGTVLRLKNQGPLTYYQTAPVTLKFKIVLKGYFE